MARDYSRYRAIVSRLVEAGMSKDRAIHYVSHTYNIDPRELRG